MADRDVSFVVQANDGRPNTQNEKGLNAFLKVGNTYAASASDSAHARLVFRVLHMNRKLNKAWVIQVPLDTASKQHFKGPKELALSTLITMFEEQQIVLIKMVDSPILEMKDEEIRAIYSDKEGHCPIIEHRDRRYTILETLTTHHTTADILEGHLASH